MKFFKCMQIGKFENKENSTEISIPDIKNSTLECLFPNHLQLPLGNFHRKLLNVAMYSGSAFNFIKVGVPYHGKVVKLTEIASQINEINDNALNAFINFRSPIVN